MRKIRGFTLVELLITILVIAILLSLAAPSFRSLLDRNAATATANDILSSILLARSEAIKREQPVIFSGSADFSTWQVAADTDNNGSGDDIVVEHSQGSNHVDVTPKGAAATITFNSRGRANLNTNNDFFTITKNDTTRFVCFSSTGRPRIEEGGCQ
ncbi:GspH/FimT family pseudopilin [Thiolapillus sp.]